MSFQPSAAPLNALARAVSYSPINVLSPREQHVLALTRAGYMPREIARRLGLSVKTVQAHYSRMKIKLGLQSMEALRGTAAKS